MQPECEVAINFSYEEWGKMIEGLEFVVNTDSIKEKIKKSVQSDWMTKNYWFEIEGE